MITRLLFLSLALSCTVACSSTKKNPTDQDAWGNYATTSDYRSMHRQDFHAAMAQGLADFDARRIELNRRANEIGGDALHEFADQDRELDEKRAEFVGQLERCEAAMNEDWPDRRDDVIEAYDELRGQLDEAFEETLL